MNKKRIKTRKKPGLSWILIDYCVNGENPPERILNNPKRTEGEMMSENEIQKWFLDSIKILSIIKEEDSKVFECLYKEFVLDLEYLYSLEKISEDVLEHIHNENSFSF